MAAQSGPTTEQLAAKIVQDVFGRGYVSPASSLVYQASEDLLRYLSQDIREIAADRITLMLRAVGREAADNGFE